MEHSLTLQRNVLRSLVVHCAVSSIQNPNKIFETDVIRGLLPECGTEMSAHRHSIFVHFAMARIFSFTAIVAVALLLLPEPSQSAGNGGGRLTLRRGGVSQIGRNNAKRVPPPPPPRRKQAAVVAAGDDEHHVVEVMTSSTAVANVLADLCPHGMLPIGTNVTTKASAKTLATWSARCVCVCVCVYVFEQWGDCAWVLKRRAPDQRRLYRESM
jgi:hypothetical protein